MLENWILGLLAFTGALGYCAWGFLKAYKQTKDTPQKETFNWAKAAITVIPPLVVGFLAGYQMNSTTVVELLSVVLAGYGQAALQSSLGVNNFFDEETTARK